MNSNGLSIMPAPTARPYIDISIDIDNVTFVYWVGGKRTPIYTIAPVAHPGPSIFQLESPFNTAQTPFLLPAAVETLGGQVVVHSKCSIPVFWKLHTTMLLNGVALTTNGGFASSDTTPGLAVQPGTIGMAGYTPIMVNHPGQFEPHSLPIHQPVLMRLSVQPYADATFAHPLVDVNGADNTTAIWVMRAA